MEGVVAEKTEGTERPRQPREHHREEGRRPESDRPMRERGSIPPDTILIGKKPLMSYATAVMMHFNSQRNHVTVKARGRAISHAVDVVEVVRRRFFGGKLVVKEVKIGTETVTNTEGEGRGESRNVSTIEIKLEKTD